MGLLDVARLHRLWQRHERVKRDSRSDVDR
jgi:hypothetical protein